MFRFIPDFIISRKTHRNFGFLDFFLCHLYFTKKVAMVYPIFKPCCTSLISYKDVAEILRPLLSLKAWRGMLQLLHRLHHAPDAALTADALALLPPRFFWSLEGPCQRLPWLLRQLGKEGSKDVEMTNHSI